MNEMLEQAADEYLERRCGAVRPLGRWDHARRWTPDSSERRVCCRDVRTPSRAYPYTLWRHVHSMRHVAALYGVAEADLRAEVSRRRRAARAARREVRDGDASA